MSLPPTLARDSRGLTSSSPGQPGGVLERKPLENVPPGLWPPGVPHSGPHDHSPPCPHPGTLPSRGCGPFSSRCLGFGVLNSRLCRFWGGCVTRISVPQRVGEESWLCVCSFPRLGDQVTPPSALHAGAEPKPDASPPRLLSHAFWTRAPSSPLVCSSVVQSLVRVWLSVTPWTAGSLSFTLSTFV